MYPVGENGPLNDATWSHTSAKNPPWCPIKENDGAKYSLTAPRNSTANICGEIRNQFFKNWQLHWAYILEIEPRCEISKFIRFIEHADSIRFWAHDGLQEWQLPYIFLATCDFPPLKKTKTTAAQDFWILYRFDSFVRNAQDVWLNEKWSLTRTMYKNTLNSHDFGPKYIVDIETLAPEPNYLERVTPRKEDSYFCKMQMYFPDEMSYFSAA